MVEIRSPRLALLVFFSVGVLTLVGCSQSELGATVNGSVTLDGEPVGPGVVTFAKQGVLEAPAVGQLSLGGDYSLETGPKVGLEPGAYEVSVQAFEVPDVPPGARSMEPSKPLVPEKYMKTSTSGLSFEVKPGSNRIDIPLSSE